VFPGPSLKMGPTGCPDTSVRNCHHSLRNNLEERSSDLLRGGSLKSCVNVFCLRWQSGSLNLPGIAKLLPELSALSKKSGYLRSWFDSTVQTQTRRFFSKVQYFAYRIFHRNNSKFLPENQLLGPALDARVAPDAQRFCRVRLGMFVLSDGNK
jgi:hypothetical protein